MCMQCFAEATPMVAVSFGLLRRKALGSQLRAAAGVALGGRQKPPAPEERTPQKSPSSSGPNISHLA